MSIRRGFSIIECLVYCFLFCLLCVLILRWVGSSHIALAKIQKKYSNTLELYGALDSFVHDVMSAPSDKKLWEKISDSHLIWQSFEGAVGWSFQDGSLYRTTGTYKGQWTQSTRNLISNTLSHVQFTVQQGIQGQILGVSSDFDRISRCVRMRKRSINGSI